jgi:hypothetical protein
MAPAPSGDMIRTRAYRLGRLPNWVVGLALTLTPAIACAHGLDPVSLSLREVRAGVFEVRWRASGLRLPGANVQPALPSRCHQIGSATAEDASDHIGLLWTVDCGPNGLAGSAIAIDDLGAAKINALLTIDTLNGETVQRVLSPRDPSFAVPIKPSRAEIVDRYVRLGVQHLARGPDHLLFILGLVLLVAASHRLLQTVAAFALGHSLTLTAATLNAAPELQPGAVELLIAVSVLALAVELARDAAKPTLVRRYAWGVAAAFGALHGLGFASDFAAIGSPGGNTPLALMSFNAGIELAEAALVATLSIAAASLWHWRPALASRSTRVAVYAMGIVSAFWCFERVALWWG